MTCSKLITLFQNGALQFVRALYQVLQCHPFIFSISKCILEFNAIDFQDEKIILIKLIQFNLNWIFIYLGTRSNLTFASLAFDASIFLPATVPVHSYCISWTNQGSTDKSRLRFYLRLSAHLFFCIFTSCPFQQFLLSHFYSWPWPWGLTEVFFEMSRQIV